ncbi:MAG: SDR family oxidoreductase [Acidobacteria bacterium]|nr:SDR family oxidoreductase [Acidobacteriota bacterium]
MVPLEGRTALVTGGKRRVGLAIANALREAGAHVIATSSQDADLSTRDGVESLLVSLPRIDLLVSSAASFTNEKLGDVTFDSFDETFALNVRAPFFLAQRLGLQMKANGFGRIVSMADIAATLPFPGYLPYSMSKAAIVTMTKGLAKALAPNVLVNAVAPGPVLLPEDFDATERAAAVEPTVLKRPGTPEEVARTIVFLMQSDYITGVTLPVDGGRLLR